MRISALLRKDFQKVQPISKVAASNMENDQQKKSNQKQVPILVKKQK